MTRRRDEPRPTDRRWRDPRGTRRASVEFGTASAGRRPPGTSASRRTPWQRTQDRSRKLVRYGRRHQAGILGWGGILGALTCMWAFQGVVQGLTVATSLGIAGTGAAIKYHQQNRTLHRNPQAKRPSKAETAAFQSRMGGAATRPPQTGRGGAPGEPPGPGYAWVAPHTRDGEHVEGYWQRRRAATGTDTTSWEPSTFGPGDEPGPDAARWSPNPSRPPKGWGDRPAPPGGWTHEPGGNPNYDEEEHGRDVKCTDCGDRGLWTSFGDAQGRFRHVPCPRCGA